MRRRDLFKVFGAIAVVAVSPTTVFAKKVECDPCPVWLPGPERSTTMFQDRWDTNFFVKWIHHIRDCMRDRVQEDYEMGWITKEFFSRKLPNDALKLYMWDLCTQPDLRRENVVAFVKGIAVEVCDLCDRIPTEFYALRGTDAANGHRWLIARSRQQIG